MKRRMASRQGGAALLVLLAVLAIGATWFMVSKFDGLSANATVRNREYNAAVLQRAKQTLIGYVLAQASKSFEDNPGALPCPEHPWYINRASPNNGLDGTAGPAVGMSNPGSGTANCGSVGRYPWRTIGSEVFTDSAGEPLWYVVGPTWRKTSTSTKTTINSNTAGDIMVDGQQVVAVIIAPGRLVNAQSGTTAYGVACAARNQARTSPATYAIDARDYLECFDEATLQFSTVGADASYNDQVVKVTVDDLMPGIEAAIANRVEREIVPVLKSAYTGTQWNASSGQTVYPFAAPFGNPTTASYQGSASPATTQGLLPFSYSPTCSPVGDARCTSSTYHAWNSSTMSKTAGSGSLWIGPSCSVSGAYVTCTGYYNGSSLTASFDDRLSNVGNALRTFDVTDHTVRVWTILYDGWSWDSWVEQSSASLTRSRRFNSDASLSFLVSGISLRWSWGTDYGYYYIEAQRPTLSDHALLDKNDSTTGWFVRNEWYRLFYYAVAPGFAPGGAGSCTTGGTCLSVANVSPAGGQQAFLILAGKSVNGSARPSSTLANYLEGGNASGSFVRQPVSAGNAIAAAQRFNDRVVVVSSN